MGEREALRRRIVDAIDQHRERILEVAETIRRDPEVAFQEYQSSELLASSIRAIGYEVEKPVGGLETAFVAARHGRGDGPVVAVLAEYDALPGLGHGCGHNLIAASGLAAAIGMGAVMDEINGVFQVIGTPAEESGSGKIVLAEAGMFDGVDASLMIHHAGCHTDAPTRWPDGTSLAVADIDYEFHGTSAHAAADPWNGANALNGVIELFTGINALRQHIRMESRIHGIITHGGQAPNVVPNYAAAKFFIRADSLAYLEELIEKVNNVARGAALVTGTEVTITRNDTCYDMRPSYVTGRRYLENMRAVGLEINPRPGNERGSTDFANVSYLMPAVTGRFAISREPIPGHSQQVVDASGSEFGYDQFIKVSKAMALTAFDLLTDPDLLAAAKEEHQNWEQLARTPPPGPLP